MNEISYKVTKLDDIHGDIWYKVECACGGDGHNLSILFEYNKDTPGWCYINFEKQLVWSSFWGSNKWYGNLWKRITGACKILFTGYIEVSESFILDGEKHIESFIAALREGQNKIKEYKLKIDEKEMNDA